VTRTLALTALALTALALTALLAGCTTSSARFADRADAACAKAQHTIDRLSLRGDTSTGSTTATLRKAIDQYTIMERLVSEIAEGVLPGGAAGQEIRSGWLEPARASLSARRTDLDALSRAVDSGDADSIARWSAAAALAGTDGVDTGYLGSHDMAACAALFAA